MKAFEQRLSDLVLDVYESATNPEYWATFLENISRELAASKAALHIHYFRPEDTIRTAQGGCAVAIGYDGSALDSYASYYATQDIYVQRVRERFPLGTNSGTSEDLITSSDLRNTEIYHDYCRTNEVFHTCWSVFDQSQGVAAGLACIRPENAPPFETRAVDLMKLLNPHLSKAFQLQRILEHAAASSNALLTSIAQFDFGVIALDREGRITNLSNPAKMLLDEQDGICIQAASAGYSSERKSQATGHDRYSQSGMRRPVPAISQFYAPDAQCKSETTSTGRISVYVERTVRRGSPAGARLSLRSIIQTCFSRRHLTESLRIDTDRSAVSRPPATRLRDSRSRGSDANFAGDRSLPFETRASQNRHPPASRVNAIDALAAWNTLIASLAASGLGLATVKAFAVAGASVVLADWNEKEVQSAAKSLADKGHKTLAIRCDVSDDAHRRVGGSAWNASDRTFNSETASDRRRLRGPRTCAADG